MSTTVQLEQELITLGQFLKFADIVSSGGEVKDFLSRTQIEVNGVLEQRRGRKLYPGDVIQIPGSGTYEIVASPGKFKS